ncbi:MAG: helix-turn-helix domain-containing protein [Thalassovita sp.]
MVQIPTYALYGEQNLLPDLLHCERIQDRAGPNAGRISAHRHAQLHQVFLILTGKATLKVEGRNMHLNAPVLINMPRGTVHGFQFSERADGFVFTSPCDELPEVFARSDALCERLNHAAAAKPAPQLIEMFNHILAEHHDRKPGRSLMLRGMACQILCETARALPEAPNKEASTRYEQIMQAFQNLVQENFRRRWRISDYADALAVTPTHLGRVVRASTGASATAFLEAILFQEACRQLAYTRIDIRQVGFDLGFDDPAYFSKMFRKRVGVSPSQYRRRVNEGA